MSKRFTDDTLWDKQWYTDLSPAEKCLWSYVKDKCDNAGVWAPAPGLVAYHIGDSVDLEAFPAKCNGNIEVLPDGKWWLVDFVEYQCGPKLNPDSKPHAAVLRLLEKHGLPPRGMPRGNAYPQEKEREEELEREEEEEEEREEGIPGQRIALDWYRRYNAKLALSARPTEQDVAAATELLKTCGDREQIPKVLDYYFGNRTEWWAVTDGKRSYNFKACCTNYPTIQGDARGSPEGQVPTRRLCPECRAEVPGTVMWCSACGEEFERALVEVAS